MLASLVVIGCAGGGDDVLDVTFDACRPVVLVPAADTAADELAGIEAALAMWARWGFDGPTLEPIPDAPRLPIVFADAAPAFRGVYEDEAGIIYVNRRLTEPRARGVTIAHELGHAFGLWHVPADARASVMNPGNIVIEPDAVDAADVAAIWGDCALRQDRQLL